MRGLLLSGYVFLLLVGASGPVMGEPGVGADRLKGVISLRFPGTEWVAREDLANWMGELDPPVVILDARREEEFAVSHLLHAVQVDPDVEAENLGDLPRDARIVVYCSVGYRSAAVAKRLSEAGYETVYNLEGGIFGWANHGLAVYRGENPVASVHPYNRTWGKLLDEKFHPEK